jgi:hypothetical protein
MNELSIKPGGDLDFLSLGALVMRLDTGHDPVPQGVALRPSTSAAASSTWRPTCPTALAGVNGRAAPARWWTTRSATWSPNGSARWA